MAKYKLGDIAPIQQGSVPESESYWLLNLDMVESNTGHIYERLYVPFDKIGTSTIAFDANNVLYSKLRPYLNKVVIPDCPGYATSEMLPLKPNKNYITREYLTYFLRSPKFVAYINEKTSGAKMPRANSSDLKSVEIECPTLENQRHITSEFDRIILIVRLRQQQLQKLDELVKARFVEMFGDPQCNPCGYKHTKLSDIATYYNGLTYKPENVAEEGTIVLRSSNIQNSQLDFADTVRVDCAIKERLMVQKNDILMCSRNGSAKLVGKVALIKDIQEPMSFGAFMMIIRSHYFGYLMTYFQMDAFRQQIKTGATTTINQITGRMLDDVTIPLPPMALVDQFAAFVEQTDKTKVAIQKALDEAQLLFDSLMQKYFG